jgi:hypothetical protein
LTYAGRAVEAFESSAATLKLLLRRRVTSATVGSASADDVASKSLQVA